MSVTDRYFMEVGSYMSQTRDQRRFTISEVTAD